MRDANVPVRRRRKYKKQERVHWRNDQTCYGAQQDILNYLAVFYNNNRLHSTLGYMNPADYEKQLTEMKEAAYTGVH